jgi:hypothetical protein
VRRVSAQIVERLRHVLVHPATRGFEAAAAAAP